MRRILLPLFSFALILAAASAHALPDRRMQGITLQRNMPVVIDPGTIKNRRHFEDQLRRHYEQYAQLRQAAAKKAKAEEPTTNKKNKGGIGSVGGIGKVGNGDQDDGSQDKASAKKAAKAKTASKKSMGKKAGVYDPASNKLYNLPRK